MEHKHTPGPWGNHLVDDTVVIIPRRPLPQKISVLGHSEVADTEDYANARLIAAAPDLLGALIKAEKALVELEHMTGGGDEEINIEPEILAARAAIAKATGATHE
ncbi:hypothetical protein EGT81_12645 [Alcaligenes faecalis]|uniref:hypothetical protein n=1 Tax=Alcaligenes faecalis TaxID=511 RepID=UPI000F66B6D0|nr:hypothetical protein [Alcaligenes faecalis]RSE60373.1 hypothetical protein EGT81_12645 [Alcaligenes faecalis]